MLRWVLSLLLLLAGVGQAATVRVPGDQPTIQAGSKHEQNTPTGRSNTIFAKSPSKQALHGAAGRHAYPHMHVRDSECSQRLFLSGRTSCMLLG